MDPATSRAPAPAAFEDGFGKRHIIGAGNEPLEVLSLRDELTGVPAFDFALRERVSRLASFSHDSFGHVRGVSRLDQGSSKLALVSDYVAGDRLSAILALAEKERIPLPIDAGLCLIRQLVEAAAILHETMRDVCHGAIGPERVVITPDARLVIVEHVLGAAVGTLGFSREQYWKELRIPLTPAAGAPRFDRRADVTQVGVASLALLVGRPLGEDVFTAGIEQIVAGIGAVSASGGLEPLPDVLRAWLSRALQIDQRNSFASAVEARPELDAALAQTQFTPSMSALKTFVGECTSRAAAPVAVAPQPLPPPIVQPPPRPASSPRVRSSPRVHVPPTSRPLSSPSIHLPPPRVAAPSQPQDGPAMFRHVADEAEVEMESRYRSRRRRLMVAGLVLIALTSGGTLAARRYLMPSVVPGTMGMLSVSTNPVGIPVVIDGYRRGNTPVTVALTPGSHVLELVTESERRRIPVTITEGGQVSQFIELPKAPAGAGELHVRTEPAGAKVTVDGQPFGRSPVTIPGLTAGTHTVLLENEMGSMTQEVTIEAGTTASLVVPLAVPNGAPVSGWISVAAPVDVQIYEQQRLLGTSRSERIMVPAGRRQLEIVNESLGYRSSHTVQVAPGKVAQVKLQWPKGMLALNAVPWADVWVDGERVGETPLGNVTVPIGPHEVVFRHPELGEQRHRIIVTLIGPARLSVDLRKQ